MVAELPETKDECPFIEYTRQFNEKVDDYVYVPTCKCSRERCDLKDNQCSGLYKF